MKKAEDIILEIEPDSDGFQPYYRYDEVVKAIKQAQIDAIGEAVKMCYDEFELFEIDGVAVGIDYNSSVKVAEQLRKEIE